MVSLIMPIRNEGMSIGRTLQAALDQDYPTGRLELLVADGMSTDRTREILAGLHARHSNLRIIDNPEGIVSTGLNRAISEARGEIIVRVDGHTVIDSDYVSRCVAALRRSRADCVGGPMRAEGMTRFGRAVAVATSSRFGVGGARFHYSAQEEWVDTVYLGCWWRRTFERIGFFDEKMVRNQDDEFNYRLLDSGGRILLSPDIRSLYTVRGSPAALWRQYFLYGFWKVEVLKRHPRQARVRHLIPLLFVLALAGSALAAPFGAPGRGALLGILGVYGAVDLALSLFGTRTAGWRLVPDLVLAYAVLHLGYGSGFLLGLARRTREFLTTAVQRLA
jgi:glycosyltransferase involved in cell wall biosynthesis